MNPREPWDERAGKHPAAPGQRRSHRKRPAQYHSWRLRTTGERDGGLFEEELWGMKTRQAAPRHSLAEQLSFIHVLIGPAAGHYSLFRVEVHGIFTQCVQVAKERILPSGEREEGHRGGHAHVDAYHAGADVMRKFPRRAAGTGKDRGSIAVFRLGNHF